MFYITFHGDPVAVVYFAILLVRAIIFTHVLYMSKSVNKTKRYLKSARMLPVYIKKKIFIAMFTSFRLKYAIDIKQNYSY